MENNIIVNGNSKEIIKGVLFDEKLDMNVETGYKVLGVTASSTVTGYEAFENEIRVNVKTTFLTIKKGDDGNYVSEQNTVETYKTITRENVRPMSKICLRSTVTECEIISYSPLKAKATVEISGWFIRENEIKVIDVNNPAIRCRKEKMTVENIVPLTDNVVEMSFKDEARMPIANILDTYCSVNIDGAFASNGTYRTEGEINLRIVAVTDNGQIITQYFSHPLATESAEEVMKSEMRIDVEGIMKNAVFSVSDEDKRVITSDISVKLYGVAVEETETECATDVYSVKNEIEIISETATVNASFCARSVREKGLSTISVNGGVGEIKGVMSPCVSASGNIVDGVISAEGIVSATVIYADEQGNERSAVCEIPFLISLRGEYSCETIFMPEVNVTSLNARPRGSSDIEVTAEMLVNVRGSESKDITVISDFNIGEEKEDDGVAIGLYIVREGETLFDVAKALNTDEETLKEQNEDMQIPLKSGDKIICYKQIEDGI